MPSRPNAAAIAPTTPCGRRAAQPEPHREGGDDRIERELTEELADRIAEIAVERIENAP